MPTRRTRATPAADGAVIDPAQHFIPSTPPNGAMVALPGPDEFEDDDYVETSADRVARMLGEVSGDERATVKVYRLPPDGAKPAWCDDYTPDQFEAGGLAMIRRKWGPGVYRIALYGNLPEGKGGKPGFGFRAREDVEIVAALDEAPHPVQQQGDMRAMLDAMQRNTEAMLKAIADNRPAPVDPLAQFQTMAQMAASMRELFGAGGQTDVGKILKDVMQLKAAADELSPDRDKTGDPIADSLPQLMELVKLGMASRMSDPGMPVPAVALPAAIAAPPVALRVGRVTEGRAGTAAPAPQALATSDPAAHQQAATDAASDAEAEGIQELQALMLTINTMAKRNGDPELAADLIYDQLPDEGIALLQGEQWFDLLSQFYPNVGPYREWYTKVRTALLDLIAQEGGADAAAA